MELSFFKKALGGGSNSKTYITRIGGRTIVRKKISKKENSKLKSQVRWLIKNQGENVPRVINHGYGMFSYFYDMPHYSDFINFGEFIQKEDITKSFKIIDKLVDFLFNEVYFCFNEPKETVSKKLDFYITKKIKDKITELSRINPTIGRLIKYQFININGRKYKNISQILVELDKKKSFIAKNSRKMANNLHGDVTIENILCKDNSFILLDPNDENSFNSYLVDLGKLYQSLHSNYEFLIKLKNCNVSGDNVTFICPDNRAYKELYSYLLKRLDLFLSSSEKKLIIFHEAVHYARMLPYKQKINKETVPIYYATMIKRFNEFLENDQANNL